MNNIVLQVAAKAILVDDRGRVLLLRESDKHVTNTTAGRYSCPGGRIEPGESFIDGLRREVREETGLEIEVGAPLFVGEWRPIILGVPHQIVGIFLACKVTGKATVHVSEEHDKFLWINPKKRKEYDIVDPDWEAYDAFAITLDS